MTSAEEKVRVLDLKPSQFAVGMQQVNHKAKKMKKLGPDEFEQYNKAKTVPVVVGPGGGLYIIDHHHHCCAMLKLKRPDVYIQRKEDWSSMSETEFWAKMIESNYVWPFDENGNFVGDVQNALPKDVQGLKNDPYRSMAAIVRKKGKYTKNGTPFAEFQLANYLRPKVILSNDDDLVKFEKQVIKGALAHVPDDTHHASKLGLIRM